ncbi:hypothetical protein, partial [Streptomyces somaliensis]|uniref:hypothetical protein n=1 Tax=Streptomyces somaliensis TaxID=78355 RepID=UPI0035A00E69
RARGRKARRPLAPPGGRPGSRREAAGRCGKAAPRRPVADPAGSTEPVRARTGEQEVEHAAEAAKGKSKL